MQLGNENSNHVNQDAESFCDNNNFNDNPSGVYEGLNDPITIPELLIAVKTLKQGKAAGNDCLLNEYFIESIDILCSHVCDIFNIIIDTGCYPEMWMEGVIIPIYTKGDKKEASNYRGITLMSCFSKLFTSIMNRRLEIVCRDNNLISDCRFGFKYMYFWYIRGARSLPFIHHTLR